jgi:hypothetical protein
MSRVLNFVARQNTRTVATALTAGRSDGSLARAEGAVLREPLPTSDYIVENKHTLLLLRSSNAKAYDWLVAHTEPEAHWFGHALVVEHGYIADFVERLRFDGFTVDESSR